MEIQYRTRDAKGNDFIKAVQIKEFRCYPGKFVCPICHQESSEGCLTRDIVSSDFTDWAYVGEKVCQNCSRLFSLRFYNYIVDPDGIRLINVRELRDQLVTPQKPPFLFVISTSQKKQLFYRARWNYDSQRFAVNLETETIITTPERMRILFDFVECLQTLGCTKAALKNGEIFYPVAQKVGLSAVLALQNELAKAREIQIPLYCGQKREITEEDAICCINSTRMI